GLRLFRSCGPLALKLCFEAGVEVAGNRLLLLGEGPFSAVIAETLEACHAEVELVLSALDLTPGRVTDADAVVVADYLATDTVLAGRLGPSASELAAWNPLLRVVQFAGPVAVDALEAAGLTVHPR